MGELVKVVSRLQTHKHIKHIFRLKGAMSCYLLLFSKSLLSLATDGKDGHALKFEKVGVLMVNCLQGCSLPAPAVPW